MADPIRVVVAGYGRLGAELARGVAQAAETELVGVARRQAAAATLRVAEHDVPLRADLVALLDEVRPQALIEASLPDVALIHARAALERGIAVLVATSGITPETTEELRDLCHKHATGAVLAPNLSLGAVLLMHLAAIAGRFFDHADIIEMHRDRKLDAPSGTALHTARLMAQARGGDFARTGTEKFTLPDVRGGELHGVGVHSIRLPGLVAHQEVLFGGLGQVLTLRHDTTSNESYVPGAILALKHASASQELTVGLASLLGLESGLNH